MRSCRPSTPCSAPSRKGSTWSGGSASSATRRPSSRPRWSRSRRRSSTSVSAVVLAAGASSRYGGVKQRELLPQVLAALAESSVDEVVVVEGAHALEAPGARLVRCEDWERGPGVSLRAGLAALGPEVTRAIVVLADGPELDPRAVDRLAAHSAAVAAASYDGTRDHPVALDRSVWEDVPDAGGRALAAELVDCSDLRPPGDRDVAGPRLALVIVESGPGIVLVHPPGGPEEAPASLPSGLLLPGETTEEGAVRLVREQTGLDVVVTDRLIEFEQEGTPFGAAAMSGFVARVEGGELREGEEGPPAVYPLDDLPAIIPVRVANQRVLDAYLARRSSS